MSSFFSSYIQSVTSIGICAFICNKITTSTSTMLNKSLSFICGLCIFISIVFPILGGLKNFTLPIPSDTLHSEENANYTGYDSLLELTKSDLSQKLKSEIIRKTGINVADICIALHMESNTIYIDKVQIFLASADIKHENTISDIVCNLLQITPEIKENGKDIYDNEVP